MFCIKVHTLIYLWYTFKNTKYIPYNSTLASFDMISLYTNIPISETIQILAKMLNQNNSPHPHIDKIKNHYYSHTVKLFFL